MDAYWSNVDWKAAGLFLTAIGTIAAPFFKSWWDGRAVAIGTTAKTMETAADRAERQAKENYEALERDRDRLQTRLDAALLAEASCEDRVDAERAIARGMDDWAHWMRHSCIAATVRARALLMVLRDLRDGNRPVASLDVLLAQYDANPSLTADPPALPLLRDAATARPPA